MAISALVASDALNIFDRSAKAVRSGGALGFLRNVRDYTRSQAGLFYESAVLAAASGDMIRLFEEKSRGAKGIGQLVDFSFEFSYMGVGIRPVQVRSEITELLELLRSRKVRTVLEIGTDRGGTLFLFARVAVPDAEIVSMNLPWSNLNAYCMGYRNRLYEKFALPGQKLRLLSIDSHQRSSLGKVSKLLKGRKLDFLFIDGDHSYDGVKKDFEMYAPLVRKGGLIGFHDIAVDRAQKTNPVRDYWNLIKKKYDHKEIAHSGGTGCGIGLIYWEGRAA